MAAFSKLRAPARAYVALVVVIGMITILRAAYGFYVNGISPQWFILAALTLFTGSFTVKVPAISAQLSVSETFVLASVLLFGVDAGVITVVLECLVIVLWMKPSGKGSIHKILFNTAAPAIAIWASGTVFFWSGIEPYSRQAQVVPLQQLFVPLLLFTVLYFILNSGLVAIALGFETGKSAVPTLAAELYVVVGQLL